MPATESLSCLRVCTAMSRAFKMSSVVIFVSIAHPKILRLPRSMKVAKYEVPFGVGRYVMSETQARLSFPGLKSLLRRLGYTVMSWLLSVVL